MKICFGGYAGTKQVTRGNHLRSRPQSAKKAAPNKDFAMVLRLVQFRSSDGGRAVAALGNDIKGQVVQGIVSTYELAQKAIAKGVSLEAAVAAAGLGDTVDIALALAEGRV